MSWNIRGKPKDDSGNQNYFKKIRFMEASTVLKSKYTHLSRTINLIQTHMLVITLFVWNMDLSSKDKWASPWSEHRCLNKDKVF